MVGGFCTSIAPAFSVPLTRRLLTERDCANMCVVETLERTAFPDVVYAKVFTSLHVVVIAVNVSEPLEVRIDSDRVPSKKP
jgi:hypothetical protein